MPTLYLSTGRQIPTGHRDDGVVISSFRERLVSFAPLGGLFAGILVGWGLAEFYRIHELSGLERIHDSAIRFFTFAFGLHGWASGLVLLQKRAIHLGGRKSLAEVSKKAETRARWLVHFQGLLIVVALVFLFLGGRWLFAYAALLFILFVLYIDEIDCGDPLRFFEFVWRAE